MEIVRKLDIPQPQVVLEVLVVDIWEEAGEEFGLDWEYSDHHNSFNMTEGLGAFTGIARYTSVPKTQLTQILFTLRALVSKEKASIRSRPRVATLNGKKATIDISLDEYFTIVTDAYGASLRTELEVVKSGVLLEITPHIGDNGNITVDVLTEVSDIVSRQNQIAGNTSGDLPIIRRRKADTRVRVKEGDAIVIGGLVETQERTKDKKVPVLISIPLVGGLFKSKESTTVTKEVIILITPRLLEEGENPFSDRNKLLSAEEELKALLDVVTPLEGRNQSHQNSPGLHTAGIAGIDRQENFPLSAQYNLLDIDKEYQSLRRKSR
jgi:type II secretory pathway component GspD/PulD (secretin)